jgi:hypothetical protein
VTPVQTAKAIVPAPVATLFDANAQTDEEALYQRKKRALVKLDDGGSAATTAGTAGTTATTSSTVGSTTASASSATSITNKSNATGEVEWAKIEQQGLIEKKLMPWIATRVRDMLGEDDVMFVSFVCEQLALRVMPSALSEALAPVLDLDSGAFVTALWAQLRALV